MKLPRFALRDLFWLVLVCALACAWWLDRTNLDAEWRKQLHIQVQWRKDWEDQFHSLEIAYQRLLTESSTSKGHNDH